MGMAALLVALFMVAIGILGIVAPDGLLTAVRSMLTPLGLSLVATLRIVIGVILLVAAPSSRAPKVLRVLGVVVVVSGIITPFFGVDRALAILDWWSGQPPAVVRLWAGLAVAFGAFVAYAVAPGGGGRNRRLKVQPRT